MWLRLLLLTAPLTLFGSSPPPSAPDVPKEIAVPPGHTLILKADAKGVQIYRAAETKTGKLEWVLEAPLADLVDPTGRRIAFHFDGPTWEASDGSRVIRDKTQPVKSAPAPNPAADIPWLLLKVNSDAGPTGTLSAATYIQRIQTACGLVPTELPKRAGTKVGVPYRAVYCFYAETK